MTAWVRLELDVSGFDEEPHRWALDNAAAGGIALSTMAELGDTDANRRALWDLNRECAADIPGRGEFPCFEEYVEDRLEVASYRPAGVVVALDGDRWVGMSGTSLRADDDLGAGRYAFNEITGVLRSHRGRGLGTATKLHAIRFAREKRYRLMRTIHHPDNAAAIRMNLRLGYTLPEEP